MRLEKWFHFWFYATLALGCICLALPTTFFVPWMPVLLAVTLVLLFLAWRHEGHWVLGDAAANHLGVFIALGTAAWILFQVPRSEEELIAGGVPWPAGLLPHLSPLLMMLLIVKVFRPKRLPDFWVIQTIGLMTVTLAAVLADAPTFGVFLVLYLVSLVWCLALYHPVREQRLLQASIDPAQAGLFTGATEARWPAPWRLGGAVRVARWSLVVLVLGQIVFLAAPRQAPSHWVAKQLSVGGAQAMRSGVEPGIDLNRTGRVELSETPAFHVTARDAAGEPALLPANQHWQVEVYEYYAGGRWYPLAQAQSRLRVVNVAPTQTVANPPTPGPTPAGDVALQFVVKPSLAGGLVLAEPVALARVGVEPILDGRPFELGFFAYLDGCDSLVPQAGPTSGRRRVYQYGQQLTPPVGERFPAAVDVHEAPGRAYQMMIGGQGVPTRLSAFARDLLNRVAGLSAEERKLDADQRVPPARHAKVARALCAHLAYSGEYRYSLELRRQDTRADPAVDFLLNLKEGHCERYAGALALLLRSVGIPCRIAKGYLGATTDEPGRYVILQNQAHSWVQALVPAERDLAALGPAEAGPARGRAVPTGLDWLVLDPTPGIEAQPDDWSGWIHWLQDTFDSRQFWRQMILEYNPEQQAATTETLWRNLVSRRGLITLATLAGAALALWGGRRARGWLRTRQAAAPPAAAEARLYERLVHLLARHAGLTPAAGATPREFARYAADMLRQRALGDELSAVPLEVVAGYYATRFGCRPLSAPQRDRLEGQLDALAASLAG